MAPGRNDPCHCGSGKKYKKCCEAADQTKQHSELEAKWQDAVKAMPKPDDSTAPAGTNAPPVSKKHTDKPSPAPQRHQTFVAPKFNMPRKAGGGG
jgi:hypothetical protein